MRRTQIHLEPEQSVDLALRAGIRGVTSSHLSREAIAQYLVDPTDEAGKLAAQRSALLAAAGTVPRLASGRETVERLCEADHARLRTAGTVAVELTVIDTTVPSDLLRGSEAAIA